MSQSMLINGPSLLRRGQQIVDTAARHARNMCRGADMLILNMNTSFGIDIAEALHVPAVMVALQPLNSTSEFPLCIYYGADFGPAFNKLTYTAMTVQQIYYNLPRNKLRRELMGLDSRKKGGFFRNTDGTPLTTLYPYSPEISPRPRDWPKSAIVTGYWQLKDRTDWQPSEAFQKFLSEGEAPVYIGFGSMPFGAERNTKILKEAVGMWGGRAVVARGWGGINPQDLPDTIFAIEKRRTTSCSNMFPPWCIMAAPARRPQACIWAGRLSSCRRRWTSPIGAAGFMNWAVAPSRCGCAS
ncbi:hypothetical protein N8D56_19100 [Devosia sp. A8/3-2]|nr:hypothetical protein N8D56_19100 [Devosia sp. A8/3-2]